MSYSGNVQGRGKGKNGFDQLPDHSMRSQDQSMERQVNGKQRMNGLKGIHTKV